MILELAGLAVAVFIGKWRVVQTIAGAAFGLHETAAIWRNGTGMIASLVFVVFVSVWASWSLGHKISEEYWWLVASVLLVGRFLVSRSWGSIAAANLYGDDVVQKGIDRL